MASEIRNIPYATEDGIELLLDLYLPDGGGKPPLLIWIHGGAWQFGSRADPPPGPVAAGYALASVDFRQATEAVFPAQLEDLRAAVRFLRARQGEYGYDGGRIAAWGASSGGHLAALLATTNDGEEDSVQAAVDFFGPSDLLTILEQSTPHGLGVRVPALELLLDGSLEETTARELARQASPVHRVSDTAAPILIVHGVQDNQVPVNQSIELHQAYQSQGRESELVFVPGAGHMDEVYYEGECLEILLAFLSRVL